MPSQTQSQLKTLLAPLEPFYFLGIGGSGMAPLARFIHAAGTKVSGFDQSPATSSNIELKGIHVCTDAEAWSELQPIKTIVRSSAIKNDHPWLKEANRLGLKVLHRSELIAILSQAFKLITVSGTHGKSTTSAMISYLLSALDQDPSYILGASLLGENEDPSLASACRLGGGAWLVIESDESDGTFLNYRPQIAVVTNIDADHMEHYGSMERMTETFQKHLNCLPEDGVAVLFWDHERVRTIGFEIPLERRLAYGTFLGCDVRMMRFAQEGFEARFSVMVDKTWVDVVLPQIGKHNAINALAALAVVHTLGLSVPHAAQALAVFPGVARRLTKYFQDERLIVYDDYAHNPVKISSCLSGLRAAFPKSKILAVFQPHRYTRLEHLYQDFTKAFSHVNRVLVVPVYAAGEAPLPGVTTERIARDITTGSQVTAEPCGSLKDAEELLQYIETEQHTIIVTVGAGDVWTIARHLSASLKHK